MTSQQTDYLDGNAAAGELGRVFALDVSTAVGQCGSCGAKNRFAEAHVYMHGPGVVARCPACGQVLLRMANAGQQVFLDVRGLTYLCLDISRSQEAGRE